MALNLHLDLDMLIVLIDLIKRSSLVVCSFILINTIMGCSEKSNTTNIQRVTTEKEKNTVDDVKLMVRALKVQIIILYSSLLENNRIYAHENEPIINLLEKGIEVLTQKATDADEDFESDYVGIFIETDKIISQLFNEEKYLLEISKKIFLDKNLSQEKVLSEHSFRVIREALGILLFEEYLKKIGYSAEEQKLLKQFYYPKNKQIINSIFTNKIVHSEPEKFFDMDGGGDYIMANIVVIHMAKKIKRILEKQQITNEEKNQTCYLGHMAQGYIESSLRQLERRAVSIDRFYKTYTCTGSAFKAYERPSDELTSKYCQYFYDANELYLLFVDLKRACSSDSFSEEDKREAINSIDKFEVFVTVYLKEELKYLDQFSAETIQEPK